VQRHPHREGASRRVVERQDDVDAIVGCHLGRSGKAGWDDPEAHVADVRCLGVSRGSARVDVEELVSGPHAFPGISFEGRGPGAIECVVEVESVLRPGLFGLLGFGRLESRLLRRWRRAGDPDLRLLIEQGPGARVGGGELAAEDAVSGAGNPQAVGEG